MQAHLAHSVAAGEQCDLLVMAVPAAKMVTLETVLVLAAQGDLLALMVTVL
ncbi:MULTISPECIES: hypothetical protein [Pantoea]|uniref:hypothetical protein n=1 Tax=Pantoea TaxID=53335 RepID=UPI001315390D|nr:hypothetical protein [Pantoea ananatis]MBA4824088.1 hypothetical protein [Pantoea ananatis]MDN4150890.1 hypothetical protein [Pantoea ananatis]QKV88213.1 hypothetical protein FOB88_14300 [Pantoea ananatis]